jgi:hypothetical protein
MEMGHREELIIRATGCCPEDVEAIEEIMRDDIFHSTLDWQTASELRKGARQAADILADLSAKPRKRRRPAPPGYIAEAWQTARESLEKATEHAQELASCQKGEAVDEAEALMGHLEDAAEILRSLEPRKEGD